MSFKDFEIDLTDLGLFLFLVIVGIFCGYAIFLEVHNEDEKKCVEFYNQNGYVLDICEKYEYKLEDLNK